MRRTLAMALLAVLVMPAFVSLLVLPNSKPDSLLPPCCRRDGKHHCAMMAMMERASQEPTFRQVPAACPYRSASMTLAHSFSFYPPASFTFYAAVTNHPAIHEQAVLNRLVSRARSHQKRGPPVLSL